MNRRVAALLLGSAVVSCSAWSSGVSQKEISDIVRKSGELVREAEKRPLPDWLRSNPHEVDTRQLEELICKSHEHVLSEIERNAPPTSTPESGQGTQDNVETDLDVVIFASFGMPHSELQQLFEVASETGVMVLFRGVPDGESIDYFIKLIHELAESLDPPPNVTINPKLFKEWGIDVVPTMVARIDSNRRVEVRGSFAVDWFVREALQARSASSEGTYDLGRRGATYPVQEKDLIEEMKRRIAAVDWDEKKRAAMSRFWKNTTFVDLPPTPRDREYSIDPTVHVTKDVIAPDGSVIALAGTSINPFAQFSFNKRVIVFDGTSAQQVSYIEAMLPNWLNDSATPVLVTTKTDVENGWDALSALEYRLQLPIYLLNKDMAARFQLKHVPSVVTSRDNMFIVNEYRPVL